MSKKGIRRPSIMAEAAAANRADESFKTVDERICYDQYAVHFLSPEAMETLRDPVKLKAIRDQVGDVAQGIGNSVRARARYFDDFVRRSLFDGLEQLIILGAGYDSRAYRIEGLDEIKVFEVDHPDTQIFKIEKVKEIFGSVPGNVVYVPIDFETEKLSKLFDKGYNPTKKSLFLLEGLIMYIPLQAFAEILRFITEYSGPDSAIIFDYYPEFVVDGSRNLGTADGIRNHMAQLGEPLQFGINKEEIEFFLSDFGFTKIQNVTSDDYKKAYFHGKNENRKICEFLYFVHAVVG